MAVSPDPIRKTAGGGYTYRGVTYPTMYAARKAKGMAHGAKSAQEALGHARRMRAVAQRRATVARGKAVPGSKRTTSGRGHTRQVGGDTFVWTSSAADIRRAAHAAAAAGQALYMRATIQTDRGWRTVQMDGSRATDILLSGGAQRHDVPTGGKSRLGGLAKSGGGRSRSGGVEIRIGGAGTGRRGNGINPLDFLSTVEDLGDDADALWDLIDMIAEADDADIYGLPG